MKGAAITSSRSKTIKRHGTSTSPQCSPNRRAFPPSPQRRWESEQDCGTTIGKGHGRLEKRALHATPVLQSYLADWPGIAQVFQLHRVRPLRDQVEQETAHGISSLAVGRADACRILELVRGHWGMENRWHGVREVTLGEDGCRVRRGSAPEVLAATRNAVVHLLEGVEAVSKAAALRRFAIVPLEAFALLTNSPPPDN